MTLFPAGLTPGSNQNDGAIGANFGIVIVPAADIDVASLTWHAPNDLTGCAISIYEYNVSPITATKSVDVTAGANTLSFDAPVTLTAGHVYYAMIFVPSAQYTATAWSGSDDGTVHSGGSYWSVFHEGGSTPITAPAKPASEGGNLDTSNTAWYGLGINYSPAGGGGGALSVNAGVDQAVTVGDAVTLHATATDATGTVDWSWTQTSGPTAILTGASTDTATFTPASAGTYVFEVTGTDDNGPATDSITVTAVAAGGTEYRYPDAAIPATTAHENTITVGNAFTVTGSTTVDGIFFYSRSAQSGVTARLWAGSAAVTGSTVTQAVTAGWNYFRFTDPIDLSTGVTYIAAISADSLDYNAAADSALADSYVFAYPTNSGRYNEGSTSALPATSSAFWYGTGVFSDTGPAITTTIHTPGTANVGTPVELTATVENANGSVTWAWEQLAGRPVTLTGADTDTATFTATEPGGYTFKVTVTDSVSSADDAVVIVTVNQVVDSHDYALWLKGTDGQWHVVGKADRKNRDDPSVFYPEDYGAKGDGVTDDTAAISACIAAAVAAAPSFNGAATVQFKPAVYRIASPPVPGFEYGNAQIPIPHVPGSLASKVVLTLRGACDNAAPLYWGQHAPQLVGTVLQSTWMDTLNNAGYGIPSVIGGPTALADAPQDTFATFSNMQVVVDGIQVSIPHYAHLGGFNFSAIGQAVIKSASVFTDLTLFTTPAVNELPTDQDSYGIILPLQGNNARSQVGTFVAYGVAVGMVAGEHLDADYLAFIYCRYGLELQGNAAGTWEDGTRRTVTHAFWIDQLLCEAVDHWLINGGCTGLLHIGTMDGEGVTNFTDHITDADSLLTGEIHFMDVYQQHPVVVGAERLRIIAGGVSRGAATAPDVPASGEALRNPFWRDATVYVHGGTVSAIKVAGATTGLTVGMVTVPTGQTIELDYTAAPAWTWVLS